MRFQLSTRQLAPFLPALLLGGFWLGGEPALLLLAVGATLLMAVAGGAAPREEPDRPEDALTGLPGRAAITRRTEETIEKAAHKGGATGCIALEIDTFEEIAEHHGHAAAEEILRHTARRIETALRAEDMAARLDGARFAALLAPVRRLDLEGMIQIAARLQDAVAEPVAVGGARLHVTASLGFCLHGRAPHEGGGALLEAAEAALSAARSNGPGAIRAYSREMRDIARTRDALAHELSAALEGGLIQPWFQPQVSTDTGEVTVLEALARWEHPGRGVVPPADFLPAVEQAGLSERLGEVILRAALAALSGWDRAGLGIPAVAVNLSSCELRNPKLADKVRWELDRFDLAPERLRIEILETVVARSGDDMIARNIGALKRMGCGMDLDDFGTGHASITSIRRFNVDRLKIDRSFVTRMDRDPAQEKVVAAILALAERLGLGTVAEGVETAGEHALLAQLGCGSVQGFAIARPMPAGELPAWVRDHRSALGIPPRIGRRTG